MSRTSTNSAFIELAFECAVRIHEVTRALSHRGALQPDRPDSALVAFRLCQHC